MTSAQYATHRKVRPLARAAYMQAREGRQEDAARTVREIYDVGGEVGVRLALLAWCDAFIDHAAAGLPYSFVVDDELFVSDTGELLDANCPGSVPEEFRWAARLFTARAAFDGGRWDALMAAVPPGEAGRYVFAVLRALASAVNTLPRGHALAGS